MAKTLGQVTLSVLDRLIDREPDSKIEVPVSHSLSVRLLKAAVRRDLEWLLNTRRIFYEPDEAAKEVNRSLYMYGLPDFSKFTMGSAADHAKLIRQIIATLKMFEPRLANVQIASTQQASGTGLQELRLRIEAVLLMDPSPEPV